MHYEILDEKRKGLLPLLNSFKDSFYLAGGTGLALQFGHRESIDFDFFTQGEFDPVALFEEKRSHFADHSITLVQQERNTLTVLVDDIQLSFFGYSYPLIGDLIQEEFLQIASVEDIACMKLSAIVSRATTKDYMDLYYVLKKQYSLSELLAFTKTKMPELDENLILKSLVYFEDVIEEPLIMRDVPAPTFNEVRDFLTEEVREYSHLS